MGFVWVFILNMQMGGLRTALILGLALIVFVAIFYKKQAVKWLCIRAAAVVTVGFAIVGFNPFMQNLLDYGNPFCLLFGDHAVNVTSAYMPWVFEGKTQLGQFIVSMLSSPDTAVLDLNIVLQQLTAVVNSAYAAADVRLRGFGFIGGALLLVALMLLVVSLLIRRKPNTKMMPSILTAIKNRCTVTTSVNAWRCYGWLFRLACWYFFAPLHGGRER